MLTIERNIPDLKGQWNRFVIRGVPWQPSFDQAKSGGLAQDAPLTPEYKALLEASVADQASGGLGVPATMRVQCCGDALAHGCIPPAGFVISPETTYILIADFDPRRGSLTRSLTTNVNWTGTGTTTIGIAHNNWLLYGKAGAAVENVNYTENFALVGVPVFEAERAAYKNRVGWTVGTGLEWAFWQ